MGVQNWRDENKKWAASFEAALFSNKKYRVAACAGERSSPLRKFI
jgi:hypothetical protein